MRKMVRDLERHGGVLWIDPTVEELTDTARLLSGLPLPRGRRVGIVGNAGGAGVLAADAAEALGLAVPELSDASKQALLDGTAAVAAGNPNNQCICGLATGRRQSGRPRCGGDARTARDRDPDSAGQR